MKKLLLLCLMLFTTFIWSKAQPLVISSRDLKKDTLKTSETAEFPYILSIHNSIKAPLSIKIETINQSASPDDYKITGIQKSIFLETDDEFQLTIKILKDSYKEYDETFKIKIIYPVNGLLKDTSIIVEIEGDNKPQNTSDKKNVSDAQTNKLMFLNAYNFDFGGTALSSNYVGHLNLFAPDVSDRWGFNSGIMKINYGQNDTLANEISVLENIIINPLKQLVAGDKYLRQINTYKTKRANTAWSFYVQPLYRLTEESSKSHIYAHAHFELLATKWSSSTTVAMQKNDTALFTPAPGFVAKALLSNTSSYTINSLFGYFGIGFTFNLKPWNNGVFFFQPTVGETSNYPQPSSINISSQTFPSQDKYRSPRQWHEFYLIRAYYTHQLNESATIVIGTDIRGLFPLYDPLYAAYVGLNISLDKAFEVITGKK